MVSDPATSVTGSWCADSTTTPPYYAKPDTATPRRQRGRSTSFHTDGASAVADKRIAQALRTDSPAAGNFSAGYFPLSPMPPDDVRAARAAVAARTLLTYGCAGAACVHPNHDSDTAECTRLLNMLGLEEEAA